MKSLGGSTRVCKYVCVGVWLLPLCCSGCTGWSAFTFFETTHQASKLDSFTLRAVSANTHTCFSDMFRCGIAYPRCRWILPLLLLFAIIFDIIAVAAQSGWVEDEDAKSHYASMWDQCRGRNNNWTCKSLMEYSWAQAVVALMIIGLIILIIAFIISCGALCCSLNIALLPVIGACLLLVAVLQIIALIIYPVKFNEQIFEGNYNYTWAYGFGWGATIIVIGCGILFCCLPRYEDQLSGLTKTKYIYSSP